MATLFISYSKHDLSFADQLANDLTNLGHNVWQDTISIQVGENISAKIENAITKCDFIVIIISRNSIKSKWVEKELRIRMSHEIPAGNTNILPAIIDDCELPILLHDVKYADFRNQYSTGLSQLHKRLLSHGSLDDSMTRRNVAQITICTDADSDEVAEAITKAVLEGNSVIKVSYGYRMDDIVSPSLGILRDAIIRSKQLLPASRQAVTTICVDDIRQEYVKTFFADRSLPKGFILCGS